MSVFLGVQLLEALPVPVYTTDAEGRLTYYNQAAAELWGHRPELGSSQWCGSWRLYWPDGRPLPHAECPMAIALKEGRPVRGVEAVAERPDGTRVPFLPFPTPLRDSSGELVGAINLLVDLSERNRAQVEAARLAAIVSSSDDAIVSKTLDGVITSWNAGAARIFGYQADEMLGQPITRIIPSELHGEEVGILAKLRQGERIEHYETVRVAKDGRRVDISLTVSPIRDGTGTVVGVSKVARDITERRQAEKSNELLLQELNHRVRNTMAVVQSIANQGLARTRRPAEFVASFTARIQALARTHTLLSQSAWQGAELRELVRDQILFGGDDDRVSCSGPSLTLEPQTALHLALVLHELSTNARKYGALSAPKGRLNVGWTIRYAGSRSLLLQWIETGSPKVSAPEVRGFGTTLIEQSMQAHGGSASVQYGADGIICELVVPLPEPARGFHAPARSAAPDRFIADRTVLEASLRGKRILVVEDEPIVAMDLAASLDDAGCIVVGPVATLEKSMATVAGTEFDGAVVDVNLGGQPVDELAAALARRNVPFAFVTGYGREALPLAFRDARLIHKPFSTEQVLGTLALLFQPVADVVRLRQKST